MRKKAIGSLWLAVYIYRMKTKKLVVSTHLQQEDVLRIDEICVALKISRYAWIARACIEKLETSK